MSILPQIIFLLIFIVAGYFLYKRISFLRRAIMLGKKSGRTDNPGERWKTMGLVAFGQKKMFKRIVPAIFHLFLYVGFIIINIEILEFVIDGLFGQHRYFAPFTGTWYVVALNIFEFLAFGSLVASVIFLIRRNIIKLRRFTARELIGWPKLDANLILFAEITLMTAILVMNATDQALADKGYSHYVQIDGLFFSSMIKPLFIDMGATTLFYIERVAWWLHIIGILGFAIYITYSKHLHIFLAFPNTYYSNLKPKGEMRNMEEVTNEVNMMLGIQTENAPEPPAEIARFGAKDVNDLSWVNVMNAFACTECGRCTDQCPANITGKKLSPRKIMMDTRDRAEEVAMSLEKGGKGLEDGKSLYGDYITKEEINACTSCNACVEACPVNIDPLAIILEMRRYVAMEESGTPPQWNAMFQNMETSFSPWKFAPSDRFNWADKLKEDNQS
ncbi:4Fe-4S dicluster domain-containing protein [Litoribacter ruber]|uniref:4Fe-4S dicluster domain-containing protein n=1 Tax=Litoribacter ruber TaxID=702568 RepID=UPI001BDA57C4|nr:4Fe-4S dicluster domain-containing protein [Litoribacter ruber]MBT0809869.1 4Fe-4S dicluster domain-containing protein [Litoribacter ruber]